jgi:peptidyl-prolyl cis-trans isomerase C
LLFAGYRAVRPAAPAPGRIEVDAPLVDRLADSFRRAWQREPGRDELAEMVLDHIDDEVLYREALAEGLDRDDPAVRRRLIEKITVMRHGAVPEPSQDQLRQWYAQRRHHFHQPGRWWFTQVFLDPGKRRGAVSEDARAALAALERGEPVAGDPSPLVATVDGLQDMQVGHLFGQGFLDSLSAGAVGRWQGPLSSLRGVHLVRLTRREPPRDPPFEEVAAAVRADWITARSKGYLDAAAGLLPRYQIEVAPAVRRRLAGAPLLAPVLR